MQPNKILKTLEHRSTEEFKFHTTDTKYHTRSVKLEHGFRRQIMRKLTQAPRISAENRGG